MVEAVNRWLSNFYPKWLAIKTVRSIIIIIINAIPLALCGMRCLYPISPIGETVPWPGENPYSKPSIRRSVYIQFNETPFIAAPGR